MATRYEGDRDYDRESQNYGRRSERYGREDDYRREDYRRRYNAYDRSGWESERDDVEDRDDRYGGYKGGYGRGSSEPYSSYGRSYNDSSSRRDDNESQRYNYPSGFRSGRSYDERGGSYDYNRGDYERGRYGRRQERGRSDYGRSGYQGLGYSGSGYGIRDDEGLGYAGSTYGNSSYGRSEGRYGRSEGLYDRGEGDRYEQERGWWDRASDAVASWFGDEDAERRRRMDRRMDQRSEYRGRGPKGYRRSDERIEEDVNDRLTDDYYLDASEIEVAVNDGEVVLTGSVNSRHDKRRAEDIADSVSGVSNVEVRLRVRPKGDEYSRGQSTSTGSISTGTTSTGLTGTGATQATPSSAAAAAGNNPGTTSKGRTAGT